MATFDPKYHIHNFCEWLHDTGRNHLGSYNGKLGMEINGRENIICIVVR